jgi:AmmeMemoRadiSam system protein B
MSYDAPMTVDAGKPLPPLRRDIEVVPYEHEGRPVFVLADSEAADDRALALSPGGMAAASLFDGRRTAVEVAAAFKEETGSAIKLEDVLRVAADLEAAGLLETEAASAAARARLDAFRRSPTRPAQFQGRGGYPATPAELTPYLAKFFSDAKGPGRPLPEKATRAAAAGLFAPHIDLHRGGPAYAWAYAALADSPPPDVIVALGVAHASPPSPWVFTKKAYETPYGPMAVDAPLYEALRKELWYDPLDDELVHRREHSLEFQALWLRRLWGDKTPPWVPILCSSFERWAGERSPSSVETVETALRAIGERLKRESETRRVLVLCGIDLAHVGPRFGDDLALTPELEKKIETEDSASLDAALSLDAEGFYSSVVKDGHWRKVCGLSAAYTGLRWLKAMTGGRARGSLLAYGQAPDPAGGIVSFASAVFRDESREAKT